MSDFKVDIITPISMESFNNFKYLRFYVGMQQNPNMFGIGFGLHLSIFSLDYGLLTHHSLPLNQQFTLSIHK